MTRTVHPSDFRNAASPARALPWLAAVVFLAASGGGCASVRTTDPPRTATEQFLMSQAVTEAVEQLSADALRDRVVFLDTSYLSPTPTSELSFLTADLRARLLLSGVRLAPSREKAQIIIEPRTGGIGIDRIEFLLGLPSFALPTSVSVGSVPVLTPELAILKSTRQRGYASIAFVAYWADTGELLTSSGPFIGRTWRDDWWLFGTGPRTTGDIPTAQDPTSEK
jgi:hypothetical protein